MKSLAPIALVCGVLALGACDGTTNGTIAALEARVTGLEQRVARSAGRDTAGAGTGGAQEVIERLDADLRSLERRLADVEAEVAVLRDTGTAGDFDDPGTRTARRERRDERRRRLRNLTATYRDKLAEVRRQYRDDPDDPGRQQALRDVVEWYRGERRAAMRDE